MVDTGLIVDGLRKRGHVVGHVIPTSENAGEWEFEVDGAVVTLAEARALMEAEDVHADDVTVGDVLEEQRREGIA